MASQGATVNRKNIIAPSVKFSVNSNQSNDDKISIIYEDLQNSALKKACLVSPMVKHPTIGPKSPPYEYNNAIIESVDDSVIKKEAEISLLSNTSTPRHVSEADKVSNLQLRKDKPFVVRNKFSECLISPILNEEKIRTVQFEIVSKALNELECRRLLNVQDVMLERIAKMQESEELIHESLINVQRLLSQEAATKKLINEQKLLNDIEKLELRNKMNREAQQAEKKYQNEQRALERNQKVRKAEEEAKRRSEAAARKHQMYDDILDCQKQYVMEFQLLSDTVKLCQNKSTFNTLSASKSGKLKECGQEFEILIKKCKVGDIKESDVEKAKKLVEVLKEVHTYFKDEIKKANDTINSELKKEEEEKLKELEREKQAAAEKESANQEEKGDLSDCFDSQSLRLYLTAKTFQENFEETFSNLLQDESLKSFRFNCQKAINIPVNAISPVSPTHILDKYTKLYKLLSGQAVDVGDLTVAASQHPEGIPFCKNVLAKKFVRQGDLTVSSKPDAAFSIASVLLALWVDFPDFGQLVLAHFYTECPYLAPIFMPQVEGQSDEAYYRSLGYQYSQSGEVEKQDKFLKRMSGIMRLFSAVLITKVRQSDKTNPLGLSEAWRWMSSILNLEPRPDICATLLFDFLEVTGNDMFKAYGEQFKKMLAYICQEYFPKLEKVTPMSAGGPMVRLEQFLQKVLKEEQIPPPVGVLPPQYW